MKKTLTISASVLALATLMFAATPAMARVDVGINIGVPGPFYVHPQPVYVQPRPVYVHPQPVYVDRHYDRHYYNHHHKHYRKHYRHDRDGDGVPNRYDRRPHNPYRY